MRVRLLIKIYITCVDRLKQEFMLMLLGQLMDWLEALGRIDLTR